MKHFDFFKFDLNLLVAFDALYTERSVTRAAQRVGLGQPAMSHALARLREQFADRLFVRRGNGIEPTMFATRLARSVREVLLQAHGIMSREQGFDPATAELEFVIAGSDTQQMALLPPLIRALQQHAPRVCIRCVPFDRERFGSQLDEGLIDLAIGVAETLPANLGSALLYSEQLVCCYNPKRLSVEPPPSEAQYLAHPHVLLSPAGDAVGVIDRVLSRRGLKRRVAVTTPFAHVMPGLLRDIDAFGLVPSRIAALMATPNGLVMCAPPVDPGSYDVSMFWHSRNEADPALRWLRALLGQVAATI